MAQRECRACGGSGACKKCTGSGKVIKHVLDFSPKPCPNCRDSGACRPCNGRGYFGYAK